MEAEKPLRENHSGAAMQFAVTCEKLGVPKEVAEKLWDMAFTSGRMAQIWAEETKSLMPVQDAFRN